MPSSQYDSVIYLGTPIMISHRDSVQDLFSMMTWEHYRRRKKKDSVKRKDHKAVKVIEYYGINTTDSKPSQFDCILPRKTCKQDLRTQHQRDVEYFCWRGGVKRMENYDASCGNFNFIVYVSDVSACWSFDPVANGLYGGCLSLYLSTRGCKTSVGEHGRFSLWGLLP